MTRPPVRDIAASVRDRLRHYAATTRQDFQRVLTNYGIERLLYRLARSPVRDRFVLKGAMLFATWSDVPFRATGDLDLLGFGDPGVETAKAAFASLCEPVPDMDDGLVFLADTLVVERTREDEEYQGLHMRMDAKLKTTIIPILIDVGFGDVIHPAAVDIDYPRLLEDFPAAQVRAYPPATVIAEKFDAMVLFGEQTSRLKDHFDIWAISKTFDFALNTLTDALRLTLENRGHDLPAEWPSGLTDAFAAGANAQRNWNAFLRRTAPTLPPPDFPVLVASVRAFLEPALRKLRGETLAEMRWTPGAGWQLATS